MKVTEKEFDDMLDHATQDWVLPSLDEGIMGIPYEEVLANDEELSNEYEAALMASGYNSFSDYYLAAKADFATIDGEVFARDNEASKATSKNKDISKLRLTQKTVMRRGKPTTLSFYEDPNKGNKGNQKNPPKANNEDDEEADYTGFYLAGPELGKPSPEVVANQTEPDASWYTVGKYSSTLFDYMFFVTGTTYDTVAGIAKKGNLLTLAFVSVATKKQYQLGLYRSLKKLIDLAYKNDYGFTYKPRLDEEDMCKIIFDYFDIKKSRGVYKATKLAKPFGVREWKKF